ncbi:hypothetical protein BIFGAL_04257 [Bifidobacterium gallicum DSM 20093 = LMG 11596]|uniref:Uncharacterized protein n=1 Tax=Bifidobacterium gallicum DSM 20093 = LMG 11596 TaxID=561180 RepID=D1NWK3_9BIFI|nr:hypothetical protein BIFGAL_04257 [Bifidobacterium gallicum DSM 20093 = LMG 11596]
MDSGIICIFADQVGKRRCRFASCFVVLLTSVVRGDAVFRPDMEFC